MVAACQEIEKFLTRKKEKKNPYIVAKVFVCTGLEFNKYLLGIPRNRTKNKNRQ